MRVTRLSLPMLGLAIVLAGGGCSSSTPAPVTPVEAEPATAVPETPPPPPAATSEDGNEDAEPAPPPASTADPTFPENATVNEAIKAVPQGIERRNIDPETLGKPIQDLSIYEGCKPGAAKVKMRIAVWDGRAVGIDLTTTPNNPKLADCIKSKLRELTWEKKVKSLNTIEYQF